MEKMTFGDSFISRLESFKEITESTTNFDEERARLVLKELEDILKEKNYEPGDEINNTMKLSDRLALRETFELAMVLNSRTRNYEEIRKYYQQLEFFYFKINDLPESQRMFMLMDLYLLVDLLLDFTKFKKLNGRSHSNIKKSLQNEITNQTNDKNQTNVK